jgi:hypothetical protein
LRLAQQQDFGRLIRRKAFFFDVDIFPKARQQAKQGVLRHPRTHRAVRTIQDIEAAELVEPDQKVELSRRDPREFVGKRALSTMIGVPVDAQNAHRQVFGETVAGPSGCEDRYLVAEFSNATRDIYAIAPKSSTGKQADDCERKMHPCCPVKC